ncbi:PEF-CTERM sorting domain-containing protein [Methanolobus psychrotolerans]|uniref:PEF-CTERM sorting domain-containing protein n=1 Tax=Methanolobus psychrotolerans TaxID=1874706 RepID=UPI000B918FF0|nr:PEF-CTERM sorting domain-containing protein [Methanolobus psychrotolerans]
MDRRLILPVIIMFASVLLVSGMVNFQMGSAQESSDSDNSGPILEDPVTVSQKAASTPTKEVSSNQSSDEAPEPVATMMYFGGGGSGIPASSAKLVEEEQEEQEEQEKDEPDDDSINDSPATQEVPEFPTIAIPMVAIIGMAFFFGRKQ